MFDARIVLRMDLWVARHLLCVALWVAAHMCDEKYYEGQTPALRAYQIAHLRS